MKCRKCKKEIPDGSKFCNFCGIKQSAEKRRADGRIEKRITIDGKQKSFYGKSEKEVLQKIAKYSKENDNKKKKPFRYYAEQLEKSWDSLAHNSLSCYKPALRRCVDKFGDMSVSDISPAMIKSFLDNIGKTRAVKTVSTHRSMISQALELAVIDRAIQINPASYKGKLKGKREVKRQPASDDDVKTIVQYHDECLGSRIAFFIMHTGVRIGEALALQWRDIDLERKRLTVCKSVYFIGNDPHIKEPKTEAGIRIVVIPQALADTLIPGKPDEYVFGLAKQHVVTHSWGKFCYEHGMAEKMPSGHGHYKCTTTFHMLRHYYATRCHELGVDELTMVEMIGHTDYATTAGYTHIREQSLLSAEQKINESF